MSKVLGEAVGSGRRTPAEQDGSAAPLELGSVLGSHRIDRLVTVDQKPIGRTPRSNLATYTGMFDVVRKLFAGTEEARRRGYTAGRFSFNVAGGRCETCQGEGFAPSNCCSSPAPTRPARPATAPGTTRRPWR